MFRFYSSTLIICIQSVTYFNDFIFVLSRLAWIDAIMCLAIAMCFLLEQVNNWIRSRLYKEMENLFQDEVMSLVT